MHCFNVVWSDVYMMWCVVQHATMEHVCCVRSLGYEVCMMQYTWHEVCTYNEVFVMHCIHSMEYVYKNTPKMVNTVRYIEVISTWYKVYRRCVHIA